MFHEGSGASLTTSCQPLSRDSGFGPITTPAHPVNAWWPREFLPMLESLTLTPPCQEVAFDAGFRASFSDSYEARLAGKI
jgi:hypothetical protein